MAESVGVWNPARSPPSRYCMNRELMDILYIPSILPLFFQSLITVHYQSPVPSLVNHSFTRSRFLVSLYAYPFALRKNYLIIPTNLNPSAYLL